MQLQHTSHVDHKLHRQRLPGQLHRACTLLSCPQLRRVRVAQRCTSAAVTHTAPPAAATLQPQKPLHQQLKGLVSSSSSSPLLSSRKRTIARAYRGKSATPALVEAGLMQQLCSLCRLYDPVAMCLQVLALL